TNDVPKALRDIMGKVPGARNAEEQKQLQEYKKQGIRELARISVEQSAIYSVAFTADGNTVAAGGSDGMVRLFNVGDGKLSKEFVSVPLSKAAVAQTKPASATTSSKSANSDLAPESLPQGAIVTALEIQPARIKFTTPNEYSQLLVTARLDSGDAVDVTRMVK